jgi:hypothetical protein
MKNSILIGFKKDAAEVIVSGERMTCKNKLRELRYGDNPGGYSRIALWNKTRGEQLYHDFQKAARKALILQTAPAIDEIVVDSLTEELTGDGSGETLPEIETDDDAAEEIAALIETAQGDARKKDVKEARERLDALGIEY